MKRHAREPLFPGVRFRHVLSLGGDCEAAHGLRVVDRHGSRGVFDWLVTPLDAIGEILADDGARLAASLALSHEGTSVRCNAYGVLYHHEFARDAENRVLFDAESCRRCREKLSHKLATFVSTCAGSDGPVLFLRVGIATNLPWDRLGPDGTPAKGADLDDLAAVIARRFPTLDFRLLAVRVGSGDEDDVSPPTDPRIALAALPRAAGKGWAVDDDSWRELFAGVAFAELGAVRNLAIDESLHWFGYGDMRGPEPASPEDCWKRGLGFWRSNRPAAALEAFRLAFERGYRDPKFLADHLGLLSGEARYGEVLELADVLRREKIATGWREARQLAMVAGHARLALGQPAGPEIAAATSRAASAAWLDASGLTDTIAAAIAARRPFALIRLGDGEARFLLGETPLAQSGLAAEEACAIGDVVWENWFGEPLSAADPARRRDLLLRYEDAVRSADVLGVCTPERLRSDTGHYGYLAWQERWLRDTLAGRTDLRFTDALVHQQLNARMPFLAALLEGQDVLGVISPHRALAEALRRRLKIGRVFGHVVPAEGRLPTAAETRGTLGPHFPGVYDRLMATLTVPRPGCVFLVAAGLLGKVYCARIKALGGIALDVGALADAWMGFDTRDGQLTHVATLEPVPSSEPPAPARHTTYGCVSLAKTGSMALTGAMRQGGFPDAVHLHWLGPRAIAIKGREPSPMNDVAIDAARRIAEPGHAFRLVTCVRDPIARIVSKAFYRAERHREQHGVDIVRDNDALIAWWEGDNPRTSPAHRDLWSAWFDDTFRTTFGFDFRAHPFDHARRSLRFSDGRLRLLVLRQEDAPDGKEAELRWLLDRPAVTLRSINHQDDKPAYRSFLERFVAPSSWLDALYEAEIIRHCYTAEERAAFRARWGSGPKRSMPRAKAVLEGQPAPPDPVASSAAGARARRTTYGCVSIGKTGSLALTAAMHDAGFADAVHLHYLGPKAIALKQANAEPMHGRAIEVARRIEDPDRDFRFVASVRDPIARILSLAFYAADHQRQALGIDIVRDPEALIAWWEANGASRQDFWSLWCDDTFGTTFGFDFRAHPFDHARKSIRYASDRLRLLVLRQEDDRARRAAELGWLLDCNDIVLRTVNDAANQGYEAAYRPFLESFVAPAKWLDTCYESDLIRHCYTAEEIAAFQRRWSGDRRAVPAQAPTAAPVPAAPACTILCLSMMKTGSTAIAESLREAGLGEEVAHLHHLGPLGRKGLSALGRPVDEVAARLDDPRHRFKVATCVRDPIARWISEAFHDASAAVGAAGAEFIRDHDAFIARIDAKRMPDYSTAWFDDSLKTTFGFDFREHPFDHGRGSLRFSSERVDLLVLRQEDPAPRKERELGWLVGRDRVPLQRRNERSGGALSDRYRAFIESFAAPERWLDLFYGTEVARHFYTETERAMFRKRWGRGRVPAVAGAVPAPGAEPAMTVQDPGRTGVPGPVAGSSPAAQPAAADAAPDQQPSPEPDARAAELSLARAELEALRGRLRDGHAVDFNDYAYRPRERDWSGSRGAAALRARLAAQQGGIAELLERFCAFDPLFRAIPVLPDASEPHWESAWLPGLDAVALYGLVATLKPRTFLEIGSGHSTRFVRRAIRDHGLQTRIVSIDPHPTAEVDAICDEVVRLSCEEVPIATFARLGAGDMLFCDGSHRSFQNSDVTVFFTEILPVLAPGVVYGLHDIFLPHDYPQSWTTRFYNEQYLLMAYLLGGASGDEIVFPAHHVWREPAYAHLRNRLFVGTKNLDWLSSSFWLRRAGAG